MGGGEGRMLLLAWGVAQVSILCTRQPVGGDKLPASEMRQGWRPLSRRIIAAPGPPGYTGSPAPEGSCPNAAEGLPGSGRGSEGTSGHLRCGRPDIY